MTTEELDVAPAPRGARPQDAVIVVPTRNRASLAEIAIASVLSERPAGVRVLVSDNSTDPGERDRLSAYCGACDGPVTYVRPPEPLAMSPHWQWALERAYEQPATHYAYLTDRMLFKPGALAALLEVSAGHPDDVIAFNHDMVDDWASPVRAILHAWSGKLLRLRSADVLELCSQSVFGNHIPRMLNCLVPREALDRIAGRCSAVFGSIAPDFCFAFRFQATSESFLYSDRSLLVHHGLDRSNGAAYARGVESPDSADFGAELLEAGTRRHGAAPIPELRAVTNAIIHEYCTAAKELGGDRFPPVDRDRYLDAAAGELWALENPDVRRTTEATLRRAGWRPGLVREPPGQRLAGHARHPARAVRRLGSRLTRSVSERTLGATGMAPFWSLAARRGLRLPAPGMARFESSADALAFATRRSRRRSWEPPELRPLLEAQGTRQVAPAPGRRA